MQDSLPADGLRLCRAGVEPAGSLRTVSVHSSPPSCSLAPFRDLPDASWAHVRRKFFDEHVENPSATTTEALDRIGALYSIEEAIRGKPPDERRRIRQDDARPRLEALKAWIEATLLRLSAKTDVAKAMRYALGRWTALSRYVDDGTLDIDTDVVEQSFFQHSFSFFGFSHQEATICA